MGEFIQLASGRWLHILAGIMWIGLLYYFISCRCPRSARLPKTAPAPASQKTSRRAHSSTSVGCPGDLAGRAR